MNSASATPETAATSAGVVKYSIESNVDMSIRLQKLPRIIDRAIAKIVPINKCEIPRTYEW